MRGVRGFQERKWVFPTFRYQLRSNFNNSKLFQSPTIHSWYLLDSTSGQCLVGPLSVTSISFHHDLVTTCIMINFPYVFKMLSYNLCGLKYKLNDHEFINYVKEFDVFYLYEFFVNKHTILSNKDNIVIKVVRNIVKN